MLTGWQQGMPSLMTGMSDPRPSIASPPSLMNYQPGQWSQLAFHMAGSPNQGPYASVPVPAGTGLASSSGGGGGGIGGTALGILGAVAKNPSLMKTAYDGISGLFGGSPAASVLAGGAPALAPVGVDTASLAVSPSVQAAIDAAAPAAAPAAAAPAAGAGAGLGAAAGAATALGLFAIPAILASTVKQHDRDASQYASMLSSLNAGPSDPGYNSSVMEIVGDIANGQTQEYPSEILQKAQQLGLYNTASSLSAYQGPIGHGPTQVSGKRQ